MALPSSPPINMLQVCAEFGAPAGTGITSFYRGGPYVPNIPQNANVPTSGYIQILQLLGAVKYVPLSVSVLQSGGTVFSPEPAPLQRDVSGSLGATASNGTGSYSYSWQYLSGGGGPGFTWSVSGDGRTVYCTNRVNKNDAIYIYFRLTVTDGVSTWLQDYGLRLHYETDL